MPRERHPAKVRWEHVWKNWYQAANPNSTPEAVNKAFSKADIAAFLYILLYLLI